MGRDRKDLLRRSAALHLPDRTLRCHHMSDPDRDLQGLIVDGARRPETCAEVLVEIILFLAAVAAVVYVWDW